MDMRLPYHNHQKENLSQRKLSANTDILCTNTRINGQGEHAAFSTQES
jgi:hypothetical protein